MSYYLICPSEPINPKNDIGRACTGFESACAPLTAAACSPGVAPKDASGLPSSMLHHRHRLRAERDITRVIKIGRYVSSLTMTVRAAKGGDATRVAVVAGLKVHKSAVKRNLIKRRIREAMREILGEVAPGYDLVVVARSGAVGKTFQELGNDLYGALGRLGLIHRQVKSS